MKSIKASAGKNNYVRQWQTLKPEWHSKWMPVGRSGKEWTDIRQNYQVKKGDRHIFVHAMNRLSIPLPWNITDTKTVHMFTEETRKLSGKKKNYHGLLNTKGSYWAANMSQGLSVQSREASLLDCPILTLFPGYPPYNRRQDAGLDGPLI